MASDSKNRKGIHRLRLQGELTIYNAASMKSVLLDVLPKHKEVEIDLAKVIEIDSAGLQLLVLAKREAGNHSKELRLVNHSEAILEIINLYNAAEYFGDPLVLRCRAG